MRLNIRKSYLKALEIAQVLPGLQILQIGELLKILQVRLKSLQTLRAHVISGEAPELSETALLKGSLQARLLLDVLQSLLLLLVRQLKPLAGKGVHTRRCARRARSRHVQALLD